MASRKLILIFTILSLGWSVFAQTNDKIKLSPIVQTWNTEDQELRLQFKIVNETDQPTRFSYIVHFNSRYGKGWKDQPTTKLNSRSSQMMKVSYKQSEIRVGDFISTTVMLYGPGFIGLIDQADQYFEVTAKKILADGKIELHFSEVLPENLQVGVPMATMRHIAKKLAKPGELSVPWGKPSKRRNYMGVLSFLPADQSRESKPETPIVVTFDEPLAQESISPESFFLFTTSKKGKKQKLKGKLIVADRKITLVPAKKLQYNTRYQVVLSNRIKSKAGNTLNKIRTWHFTTRKIPKAMLFGPANQYLKVLMVSPRVKGLRVLTDAKIHLRLSGIIDPETVKPQFFYLSGKGGKVSVDSETSKDRIILTPKSPLEFGTIYTAVATPGIRDKTGKGLKKNIKWQFQTRVGIAYPETDDGNILIFSPSHEPVSYVKEKQGTLKIGITAFSNLLHADVNGQKIPIKNDSQIEFSVPYTLKSKATPFEITTFTKEGKARKKFIIHFGNKPKRRKPPFQLIAILSAAQVDNLNNVPAETTEPVSASKAVLTLVPQYDFKIGDQSVLRFKGILLREKYAKEEYQSRETSYTQAAIEWEERKTFLGTLTAGVGWNFIRLNNSNFIGENGVSEETYFSGEVKNIISKTTNWKVGLEYKNKDATADAAEIDNETDGTEITFNSAFNFKLGPLKNKTKLSYTVNDAVGKYQDYSSASATYKLSIPIGDFTPSLGYSYKYKQMKIVNPSESVKPEYATSSTSAKIKYKLFPGTSFTLGYKNKNQVSNLASSTYIANTVTLSAIQIF